MNIDVLVFTLTVHFVLFFDFFAQLMHLFLSTILVLCMSTCFGSCFHTLVLLSGLNMALSLVMTMTRINEKEKRMRDAGHGDVNISPP